MKASCCEHVCSVVATEGLNHRDNMPKEHETAPIFGVISIIIVLSCGDRKIEALSQCDERARDRSMKADPNPSLSSSALHSICRESMRPLPSFVSSTSVFGRLRDYQLCVTACVKAYESVV